MTLAESAARLIDQAPPWLRDRRSAGAEKLADLEMPSPADEVWRYVDLGFDLANYPAAAGPGAQLARGTWVTALAAQSGSAVLVDGHVVDVASDHGVTVAAAGSESVATIRDRVGTTLEPGRDIFTAAHAAFSPEGLVVHVARNTAVTDPVVVDAQAATAGTSAYPHITVVLERNSEASIVIVYRSPDDTDLVHVPHVEAFVDDGARLRITSVQVLGSDVRSVGSQQVVLGRDASARLGEIGLGAGFSRLRLGIDLDGAGSSFNGSGLYFGDRDQVHDYRVFITHRGPRTSSDLFLKGAVEDSAQAVWTGLVRIEGTATGTTAFETNRNLVLSDGAKVNSVPNLEILTDDLQCGHGSSSGPLEEEHLYYLMSRGINRERAERLLVRGFFEEIIQTLPTDALADPIRTAVYEKFVAAQEAGRVL
ncbi:MAG: Fe-S cluster assembly protein SufD [Acidimicrobiia bacterium]|nr:Fe-S cluster assembly protein SufD [Acidimicrobiia bacterium]